MRTRFGIGGAATAPTPNIQFEDFQPKSEWKEEDLQQQHKAQLLLLHLPDFKKEQLKVTYVQSSRTLRVTGERPLSDTKRSRFNVTFSVPQNCDATKIQGKFQDEVLILTMPHLPIIPAATTTATTPAVPAPPPLVPPHQAVVNEATVAPPPPPPPPPPAAVETTTNDEASSDQKRPATADHDEPPKEEKDSGKSVNDEKNEKDDVAAANPIPELLEKTKEAFSVPAKAATTKISDVVDHLDHQVAELTSSSKKTKESPPPDDHGTLSSKELVGNIGERMKEATSAKAATTKISDFVEDHLDRQGAEVTSISKKRKESPPPDDDHGTLLSKEVVRVGERMKKTTSDIAGRKKAKGLGILERVDELIKDEDNRQTMVNVGLAVIAVVAVGAFVVYRYRSSFRD